MGFFQDLFRGRFRNITLLRAIQNVASADSPQNRARLYHALLDCVLFIPVREIPESLEPATVSGDGLDISLLQLVDSQQKPVTPAFTDEEALRNWDPNTPFLGIKSRAFFRMVKATDISAIVMNPFDPIRKTLRPGGRITRFEFEALAEGMVPGQLDLFGAVPMTFAESKTVLIGQPISPPSARILDAVIGAVRNVPEIKQLYLFQMGSEQGDSRAAIGIEWLWRPEEQRAKVILGSLAQAVHPLLTARDYLDFMVIEDSTGDAIRQCGRRLLK